ncbi:MAG: hypothetical protein GX259_01920 [Bacteroidales bacterium]|jgi:hypothetical protein|nr:hypothetical protein [Bacteroidales bacterium]
MTKQILYILTTILLIGCGGGKDNRIQLLEKYDFNSGNYKLYGILSEGDPTYFTEKVGDFVISDTITLNKIKKDWCIQFTDKRMSCGYSYLMILMENDSCVYHFGINLYCKYLTCEKGWFKFPENLLNKYENSVTKIPRQVARDFHDTLISKNAFN